MKVSIRRGQDIRRKTSEKSLTVRDNGGLHKDDHSRVVKTGQILIKFRLF